MVKMRLKRRTYPLEGHHFYLEGKTSSLHPTTATPQRRWGEKKTGYNWQGAIFFAGGRISSVRKKFFFCRNARASDFVRGRHRPDLGSPSPSRKKGSGPCAEFRRSGEETCREASVTFSRIWRERKRLKGEIQPPRKRRPPGAAFKGGTFARSRLLNIPGNISIS